MTTEIEQLAEDLVDEIEGMRRSEKVNYVSGILNAQAKFHANHGIPPASTGAGGDLETHRYSPSAQHMGDCKVCGRVDDDPVHTIRPPTPTAPSCPATDAGVADAEPLAMQSILDTIDNQISERESGCLSMADERLLAEAYRFVVRGGLAYYAGEPRLSHCGYCKSWHSKPCGEGCHWEPSGAIDRAVASSAQRGEPK